MRSVRNVCLPRRSEFRGCFRQSIEGKRASLGRLTYETRAPSHRMQSRQYHFASTDYNACFGNLPQIDGAALRLATVERLKKHEADPSLWFEDPVVTVVNGQRLGDGKMIATECAFGKENGRIIHATQKEVDSIIAHLQNLTPCKDYRKQIRAIEQEMLSIENAAELVALQAADFYKQDGVTEIEEAVEANEVERRMNDLLLQDEQSGVIEVNRAPAFVGCVSNFSNFLDLSRKTLRHLEVGVPCVVLSRSNTTQHMYRWFQTLQAKMKAHGVDLGMLTYASAAISDQQQLLKAFPKGAMHITSSREVAEKVRSCHANTLSSTGGPNTLVSTEWTPEIAQAIRWSAAIENAGQCTALRHAVVSGVTSKDIEAMFEGEEAVTSSSQSLEAGAFANLFDGHPKASLEPGYTETRPKSHGLPCAYKINNGGSALPADGLDEHWREVYVDVSTPATKIGEDKEYLSKLAKWLVRNQPITLAINGSNEAAMQLFEETGQVVYSVGDTRDACALTCQARPQEGEVFGEFPPRKDLSKYTKFPMVVPSPTAAYNSSYGIPYLERLAADSDTALPSFLTGGAISNSLVKGYCVVLAKYLRDATADGPREGFKSRQEGCRTVLYGLQRPPLNGQLTMLRCENNTSMDALAPVLLPFVITNASEQVRVSIARENTKLQQALEGSGVMVDVEDSAAFEARKSKEDDEWYNLVRIAPMKDYPLAAQWISLFFPLGHIKSTKSNDQGFLKAFRESKKWLRAK